MNLTKQDIEYVADLARIKINETEKEYYATQLSVIFDYIDQLAEVPTENVMETCQVTGLVDRTRDDSVESCDEGTRLKLLQQFPESEAHFLRVKEVFKEQ